MIMLNVLRKKLLWVALLLTPLFLRAQTNDPTWDRLDQMMRRMQEQMFRGMPFDTSARNGELQISPDSSSYFYFHVDTSFQGGNGSQFFQFSPFGGSDTPGMGFDRFFDDFFNRMNPSAPRRGYGDLPADDGDHAAGEGDLLPEERLRQQENSGENPQPKAKPAPAPAEKSAQSKVKTIRI